MRLTLATIVLGLITHHAFAKGDVESFCSSELSATFRMLTVERKEAAKQSLLEKHRDDVFSGMKLPEGYKADNVMANAANLPYEAYLAVVKDYLSRLEEKVDWGQGKKSLVAILHAVIREQSGSEETKKELEAQVDETSIVPFSHYLKLIESAPLKAQAYHRVSLPTYCGGDALMTNGLAFPLNGRKVFAFCPGVLLRASIKNNAWAPTVQTDALMFTAFHEFGHLLGADPSSRFRSMHSGLVSCIKAHTGSFGPAYEDEVLADFWGAVTLVAAMKGMPQLTSDEKMDLVAVNLSALKNGSFGSPNHLTYGGRQQIVLGEACRHLLNQPAAASDCRLNLSQP